MIWGNWGPERLISSPRSHKQQEAELRPKFRAPSSPARTLNIIHNTPPEFLWQQSWVSRAYITLGLSLGHLNDSVSTGESLALLCAKYNFFLWSSLLVYRSLEFRRTSQGHKVILFTQRGLDPWCNHLHVKNTWFSLLHPRPHGIIPSNCSGTWAGRETNSSA